MTQDSLLIAIEEDAAALSRRIVAEAEEAASEIIKKAEEDAASAREKRLSALRREIEKEKTGLLNRARIRSRAEELSARQEAVDGVIRGAAERLYSLAAQERVKLLKNFYEELRGFWEGLNGAGVPVILVNPADVDVFKKDIMGKYGAGENEGAEVRAEKSVGLGVVFISGDGRYRFENTVASRVKQAQKRLKAAAHRALFGGSSLQPAHGRRG
jgi:vacuolar-type H+-ATPase subunit E/Vma4